MCVLLESPAESLPSSHRRAFCEFRPLQSISYSTRKKTRTCSTPGAEHLVAHEEFLTLETLPRRIVLVGGGYIAAEFAHIAARVGAQVAIVQRGERILEC